MQPYGPAVLRLSIGLVFVAHGAQKLFGVWGGGGPSGTAAFFAQLGLTPALPLALLVGLLELGGGLLLMAGAFTTAAALLASLPEPADYGQALLQLLGWEVPASVPYAALTREHGYPSSEELEF